MGEDFDTGHHHVQCRDHGVRIAQILSDFFGFLGHSHSDVVPDLDNYRYRWRPRRMFDLVTFWIILHGIFVLAGQRATAEV